MKSIINKKQILVIGSNAAIIKNSINFFLEQNYEVIGVSKNNKLSPKLKKNRNFTFYKFDLYNQFNKINDLCKKIQKKFPYINTIIHAQGGSLGHKEIISEYKKWEESWKVNFACSIIINNYFLKNFEKNKYGRILHIGSTATNLKKGSATYSSTKAATYDYVRKMGNNFANKNIYINCIKTSIVSDKFNNWNKFEKKSSDKAIKKLLSENLSTQKFGRSEYFTPLIEYLCSKKNQFITGSIIDIDGGFLK